MQYFIGSVILVNIAGFALMLAASPFLAHSIFKK